MPESKPKRVRYPKPKNKGGRPRKVAEMIEGKEAATRFAAGMRFALAGGPHETPKP